jgi:cytochrome c oxidase subunit 3
MDIPYTIEARPDTGLYNAKLGIWLFLASEVMLFGGLFSAYVLLRVGAPEGFWPHGWLSVPLGTLNTLLLALSAITTLLAWVACKVNDFRKFKMFHALTLVFAMTFLCIKAYEYHDKWIHYEIHLKDGRIADGHLVEQDDKQVVIEGRIIPGDQEQLLYDLRSQQNIGHDEIKLDRNNIAKMENYGPRHNTFTAIYFTMTGLHALHILGGCVVIGFLWGPGSRMWKTDHQRFTNRIEVSGLFWHFVDLVWIFLYPVLYLT